MHAAHPTAEVIAQYIRDCSAPHGIATTTDPRLGRLISHITVRLPEHLDLDEIAAAVRVPRRTLTWLVRRDLGCSVGELVTWLRLKKATELLAATSQPITDVALAAGYSSANKMANHFARHLGTSPREYRSGLAKGSPAPAPRPADTILDGPTTKASPTES